MMFAKYFLSGITMKRSLLIKRTFANLSQDYMSVRVRNDIPPLCGPSVRKLLEEYDIKYTLVPTTGPHNNLLKGDVLGYIRDKNLKLKHLTKKSELPSVTDLTFTAKQPFIDIPLTAMRKQVVGAITESKQSIPHSYISSDCKVDKILEYRKQLKCGEITVSVNDFIIKCVAAALRKVPKMNVVYLNGQVKFLHSCDISIPIATEEGVTRGVIKNADDLSIQHISEQMKKLTLEASKGKLKNEAPSSSFSISNLGMFGVLEWSAVISPAQSAILAVGMARSVIEQGVLVKKMKITLSYDCRIICEDDAGQFLLYLKQYLENPVLVIV